MQIKFMYFLLRTDKTGKTYFFAGTQFWRFNERTRLIDAGYPRQIETRWGGIPANINTAVTLANGRYN